MGAAAVVVMVVVVMVMMLLLVVCVLGWGRLDARGGYFYFSGLKVWGGGESRQRKD